MKEKLIFIALMLQTAIAFSGETLLSDEYILGKWSTDGKAGCTSDEATNVTFHDNHTLESGKGGAVTTLGFWHIGDGKVIVHLLVSPTPGRESHPFFQQNYYYQYMAPTLVDIKPDSIDYTHDTGVEAGVTKTLTRCR